MTEEITINMSQLRVKRRQLYFDVKHQCPVVERVGKAIHWINRYPTVGIGKTNYTIHWIVIYPAGGYRYTPF